MFIFSLCLISQFSIQYENFINSPRSDSVFIGLTRGDYKITDFANDAVVLWFWRTSSADPQADSLLKKISLRNNFYLSSVLRWEAKEANNYEEALNKLNLATHFDSTAIENMLSYITMAIRNRKFNHLKTVLTLPVFSTFRNQVFIITNLLLLFFISFLMCGSIYILVKAIYYLPVLSHRIDLQKHSKTRGILPFILLLIPVLMLRNLYAITICYGFLLIFIMDTAEKNWLRSIIIILLIFTILPLPLNSFVAFLKQHNRSYQLYEMVNYDTNNSVKVEDVKEKEILAYGLKQQGKLAAAFDMYDELYVQGNRNAEVINNLANINFLNNRIALAETLYKKAMLSENRGEPYFNMGLLKLRNIEYLESSRYMEEAKKRNFSSPLSEPVDIKPTNDDLYEVTISTRSKAPGLINRIYFLPLLIIFFLSFLPLRFSPPFYCVTCGQPICDSCLKKINAEVLCEECFTKFKSTRTGESEETLRMTANQGRRRLNKIVTYLINIIVPGSGVIFQGRNFVGLLIVFLAMISYTPLLFSRIFVVPADWIALSLRPIFIIFAIIIALLCYVNSFALIRRGHAD